MNTVELLLGLDAETITKIPEAEVELPRLSALTGETFIVKVKALSGRRFQRINDLASGKNGKANNFEANLLALVDGVISPDLNNADLLKKFGAATPKDLAEKLFNIGEVNKLAAEIVRLSGVGEASEDEVKN